MILKFIILLVMQSGNLKITFHMHVLIWWVSLEAPLVLPSISAWATPLFSEWCSSVGLRLLLCFWQTSGFSTPLCCHPAANPISSLLVLQASLFSPSRKGIPIEIPEASFSVLHQLFSPFLFLICKEELGLSCRAVEN